MWEPDKASDRYRLRDAMTSASLGHLQEIVVPAYIERPDGSFVPLEAAGPGDFGLAVASEWYQAKTARSMEARTEHERRAEAFERVGSLIRQGAELVLLEGDRHREALDSREPVSPELVLVDPELAERVRRSNPGPTSLQADTGLPADTVLPREPHAGIGHTSSRG